jgi:threonine/homoserine/homoserine lactone efflux protein
MAHLAAFAGISLIVIAIPGQDTALTIRNTLAGGRRNGLVTALGIVTGQAIWTLATSAGVAAILLASHEAFTALKLVGAAYLVYLGARALLDALRARQTKARWSGGTRSARTAYRQGTLSNLGNAKIGIFFTGLLPQFGSGFFELCGLGLLFATLTLLWLTPYVFVVARASNALRRVGVRRLLDAVCGVSLVGLGVRLVTERH